MTCCNAQHVHIGKNVGWNHFYLKNRVLCSHSLFFHLCLSRGPRDRAASPSWGTAGQEVGQSQQKGQMSLDRSDWARGWSEATESRSGATWGQGSREAPSQRGGRASRDGQCGQQGSGDGEAAWAMGGGDVRSLQPPVDLALVLGFCSPAPLRWSCILVFLACRPRTQPGPCLPAHKVCVVCIGLHAG